MKGRSQSSSIRTKRSNVPKSRPLGELPGTRRLKSALPGSRPHTTWTKAAVLRELQGVADPRVKAKMEYFGVKVPKAHGVSTPVLQQFAKAIGKSQELAEELWESGIHEARILATLIGEPDKITGAQMERWVRDFNSWDVVDAACCYLYALAKPAWTKVDLWSKRSAEYEKRAAFSLLAYLSYKDREASDARFAAALRLIEREAGDERNFVRKAVNWALRNIGKRNLALNRAAIESAERIRAQGSRAARWIAADALRELKSDAVQARLRKKIEDERRSKN